MTISSYFLGNIKKENWDIIYKYILNKSYKFKVYLPYDKNGFDEEFYNKLTTLKITIKDWTGCKGMHEIIGQMNGRAIAIFTDYLTGQDELWSYKFLDENNQLLLYVGDYSDRVIQLPEEEMKELKTYDVGIDEWIESAPINEDEQTSEDDLDFAFDLDKITAVVDDFFKSLTEE